MNPPKKHKHGQAVDLLIDALADLEAGVSAKPTDDTLHEVLAELGTIAERLRKSPITNEFAGELACRRVLQLGSVDNT